MSDVLWSQLAEAVEYIRNDDVHDAALRLIEALRPRWHPVTERPPFRVFVPGRGVAVQLKKPQTMHYSKSANATA